MEIRDGLYAMQAKAIPRPLQLHVKPGNSYVTVRMSNTEVKLLAMHVRMDLSAIGPPIVHQLILVGFDPVHKKVMTESLSVDVYQSIVPTLFMRYMGLN